MRPVTNFSSPSYWENFYARHQAGEESSAAAGQSAGFEWFVSSEMASEAIANLLNNARGWSAGRALHIGCGTSTLGPRIAAAQLATSVVNTDTSERAIAEMQGVEPSRCEWLVDDCCASSLESGSFSLIVDKGTMDAVGFSPDPAALPAFCGEMERLLAPAGFYIRFARFRPSRNSQRLPNRLFLGVYTVYTVMTRDFCGLLTHGLRMMIWTAVSRTSPPNEVEWMFSGAPFLPPS